MDAIAIAFITIALLFFLVIIGFHIAYALAFVSFIGIWMLKGDFGSAVALLGSTSMNAIREYVFAVLPLFVLMGSFMTRSGAGSELYAFANGVSRRVPGGLGVATVIANAIFAAVTGVSLASVTIFCQVAVPEMEKLKYDKRFAIGTIAGSSVLGMLIPPSVLFIIYGILTEVSIGKLFMAGVVPGLVLTAIYTVGIIVMAIHNPQLVGGKYSAATAEKEENIFVLLWKAVPVFALVVIVLGGIWGGYFTPTEAAGIGAAGAGILAIFKKVGLKELNQCLLETASGCSSILILLLTASMYSRMLSMSGILTWASKIVIAQGFGPYTVLAFFILIILVMGFFLDSTSILLIGIPLMAPIMQAVGFDLIWFGVVAVIAVEMGLLTPPFGMAIFAIKATLGDYITIEESFAGSLPFLLMMFVALLIVIIFPGLSTWLPNLMLTAR
jgi:tripartite ATP-independent transporter DctM subunit